ncbi:unnamed protein product [Spodoptera exigua]|nr:unnamed protein product [Spodoptera exigua]
MSSIFDDHIKDVSKLPPQSPQFEKDTRALAARRTAKQGIGKSRIAKQNVGNNISHVLLRDLFRHPSGKVHPNPLKDLLNNVLNPGQTNKSIYGPSLSASMHVPPLRDHVINAFLEFVAVVEETKQVN